jgi:hypothetical protein
MPNMKPSRVMDSGRILLVCISFLQVQHANAEQKPSWLTIKGFGTLAGTGTDSNTVGFRRDITRTQGTREAWDISNDSRFGVQVDTKFSETMQATVQWVAKDHAGDFIEQNLEWAFLRWTVQPDLNVRVGRLGADVFMLSDYRNVSYAYPWIRPPHEFYGNVPYYHFDGMDITKKFDVAGGFLSVKAFSGYSFNELPTSLKILFKQESLNVGGTLQFEKNDWRVKAGYAHLEMLSEIPFNQYPNADLPVEQFLDPANSRLLDSFWPGVNGVLPNLYIKGKEVNYASLGAAYDDGVWLAQAEAAYISTNTTWFPDQANGYLNIGRRFSSVTVYSLLGIAKSLDKNIAIPKPPQGVSAFNTAYNLLGDAINGNGIDEKSISLGLRWDFYTNMALKGQWSHYWLGKDGDRTWVTNTVNVYPDHVNVFSVGVDFIF